MYLKKKPCSMNQKATYRNVFDQSMNQVASGNPLIIMEPERQLLKLVKNALKHTLKVHADV